MLDFLEDLIAHLRGITAVSDIVGTRIYLDRFPLNAGTPNVTVEIFLSDIDEFIGGEASDIGQVYITLNAWGSTPKEALQARDVLHAALFNYSGTMASRTVVRATRFLGDVGTSEEPTAILYRRTIRFQFWYKL